MNPELERILSDKRSMTTIQVAKGYGLTAREPEIFPEQASTR